MKGLIFGILRYVRNRKTSCDNYKQQRRWADMLASYLSLIHIFEGSKLCTVHTEVHIALTGFHCY